MLRRSLPGLLLSGLTLVPLAQAQTSNSPSPPPASTPSEASPPQLESTLSWRIQPRAWYVAPDGKLRLPGQPVGSASVELDDFDFDSPRLTPAAELSLRSGNWSFTLNGFAFSSDRTVRPSLTAPLGSLTLTPGTPTDASLDYTNLQFDAGYTIAGGHDLNADHTGTSFIPRLDLVAGVRADWVDFSFAAAGAATSHDEFFLAPLAGIRFSMEINQVFTIDTFLTASGWQTGDYQSLAWDIGVAGTWHPIHWLGLQLGYRQLTVNLEQDDAVNEFAYNGALAGLFFGAELRF